MMTFYRKDVFESAGIGVPVTWDDVIEACKEIHDPDNERYAYCAAMARNFWAGYQYYGAIRRRGLDGHHRIRGGIPGAQVPGGAPEVCAPGIRQRR